MTFDPHSHPHDHPAERRLATVDAGLDSGHARAHSDVWLSDVSAGYGDRVALENVEPRGRGRARCSRSSARTAPASRRSSS